MMEQGIPDSHDEEAATLRGSQAPPVLRFEPLVPFTVPIGLLDGSVNSDSPRWRESSPEEAVLDILGRCKPRQNPTRTSLPQFKRDLARAWRSMLALQIVAEAEGWCADHRGGGAACGLSVYPSLLFNWRRQVHEGRLGPRYVAVSRPITVILIAGGSHSTGSDNPYCDTPMPIGGRPHLDTSGKTRRPLRLLPRLPQHLQRLAHHGAASTDGAGCQGPAGPLAPPAPAPAAGESHVPRGAALG